MRRTISFGLILAFAAVLSGCTNEAPPKPSEGEKVRKTEDVSGAGKTQSATVTSQSWPSKEAAAVKDAPQQKSAPQRKEISDNNEGYALLYDLVKDDGDVSKIFIIKHVGNDVNATIKDVAAFARDAKKQLDEFAKADRSLSFERAGLPKIEQEARDATKKTDTHALLGSSGPEFERRLVFLQAQAMSYANDLADALKTHEGDGARKKFLDDVAAKSAALQDRLLKLLEVKQPSK